MRRRYGYLYLAPCLVFSLPSNRPPANPDSRLVECARGLDAASGDSGLHGRQESLSGCRYDPAPWVGNRSPDQAGWRRAAERPDACRHDILYRYYRYL